MSVVPATVWLLSKTFGLAMPLLVEVTAFTTAVKVKLEPLSRRYRRWMAPLALSAGTPPVATIVVAPAVRFSVSVFATDWVPTPVIWLATEVVLVYVIDVAALLEKLYTAAPEGEAPVIVLPLALMSLRMPKYTRECAARFTLEHVMVTVLSEGFVPVTPQLPPPGSV